MKKGIRFFGIAAAAGLLVFFSAGIAPAGEGHKHHSGTDRILASYLHIQKKLANDSTEGIADEAKKISHQVDMMKMNDELLTEIGKHASRLSGGAIEDVRNHFAHLSQAVIAYREKPGGHHEKNGKLFVFYCPMEKKYWIQDTKDVSNPFLGSKMSTCGSIAEGTAAEKMEHGHKKEKHGHDEH